MLCSGRLALVASAWLIVLGTPLSTRADGQQSAGNTDGLLTWRLGALAAEETARRTVLIVHGPNRADTVARLDDARAHFRLGWSDNWAKDSTERTVAEEENVWIKNPVTDFALAPDGAFFWELGDIQSLRQSPARSQDERKGMDATGP